MNRPEAEKHLKAGFPIWCEGEKLNVRGIEIRKKMSPKDAYWWLFRYWCDHN